jgi:hypothetical protein
VAHDVLGRAPEVVGRVLDHLLARLADRLAGLAGDHAGDLLRPLHTDVGRGGRSPRSSTLVGATSEHRGGRLLIHWPVAARTTHVSRGGGPPDRRHRTAIRLDEAPRWVST